MRSYLIAGGAGLIGSYLTERLIKAGHKVIVIDNLLSSSLDNLEDIRNFRNFRFYNKDLANYPEILKICKKEQIEVYVNLATFGSVRSLLAPETAYLQEAKLARTGCQLARTGIIKRLIHFSTAEVYWGIEDMPITEEIVPKPNTAYGAGKLAGDVLVETYKRVYNIDAFIIRPFNVFGPRQTLRGGCAIIPAFLDSIISGKTMKIYGTGEQTRDFIFIKDIIEITIKLLHLERHKDMYLLSSQREIPILDLLDFIKDIANQLNFLEKKPRLQFENERKGDTERCFGRNNWSFSDIKMTTLEVALKNTLNYHQRNFF